MGGARLKIHDSLSGYEENRLVRTKTFSAHNKPEFTMMCAKRAFLRTPEVEQPGEHRVFPMTRVPPTTLQHQNLSFSASLVTLIILSHCVVLKKT